jgi:hypothetical protein
MYICFNLKVTVRVSENGMVNISEARREEERRGRRK